MRFYLALLFLASTLVAFQNCGNGGDGQFPSNGGLSASDCGTDVCIGPEEAIWIRIMESNPYTVYTTLLNNGQFNVSGRCGYGTFQRHTVRWEITELEGAQRVLGSGFEDGACKAGIFTVPVRGNNLTTPARYELSLEILGLGDGGQPISNPLPASVSRVDVITALAPPPPPDFGNDGAGANGANGNGTNTNM